MNEYAVRLTEPAETDARNIYLRLAGSSPDAAQRWADGFDSALASLSTLPTRCSLAREHARYPDTVVRQLLYRFGRATYRIVFFVIEPDNENEKGIVRVLQVRDARQQNFGTSAEENDE